jgi:anti-sigma regulatory factor (Ser/Thr protein kinase)
MTQKEIRAPGTMGLHTYGSFVASCQELLRPSAHYNRIVIDLSAVKSFSATGMAVLTSTMLLMQRNHTFDRGRYIEPKRDGMRARLAKLGFNELLQGGERGFAMVRDRMREIGGIVNVTNEAECENVAGWLASFAFRLLPEAESRNAFRFCCAELLDNVFHHAYSPIGAVACAHMDEKNDVVELAIADAGMGLLRSFRDASPHLPEVVTEEDAVRCALMPETTSKPLRHSGVGLFFTRKVAVRSGGLILLHSGGCRYIIPSQGEGPSHASRWPGTLVSIRIPGTTPISLADIVSLYRTRTDIDLELNL